MIANLFIFQENIIVKICGILLLLQIYAAQRGHCVHDYKYVTVNIYGRDLLIFIRVTSRQIYPNTKQLSTFT